MSAHIEITGTESRTAGQLRYLVDRLRQACDDLAQLRAVAAQANLDAGGLAALFGIGEENAQAVLALLASVETELAPADSPFLAQLLSRVG